MMKLPDAVRAVIDQGTRRVKNESNIYDITDMISVANAEAAATLAFTEGAKSMRERAAKECKTVSAGIMHKGLAYVADVCEEAIRTLEVE